MRKGLAMMLGFTAVLGLWIWSATGSAADGSGVYADGRLLLKEAAALVKASEPVKLVLKKSGPYRAFSGGEELLRDGNELSRRIGLPQADRLEEQEGERVYRQEAKTPEGCTQTLLLAEIEAGQSFAIVKYECTLGLADAAAVMAHQQELDAKLAGLHFDGRWNVMVQGELARQDEVQPEALLDGVRQAFHAKEAERYTDSGTLSISYSSDILHESVMSGNRTIHLQAALHRDSVNKSWRLTLGTPVITTEY